MRLVAERAARGEWSIDEAVRELDGRADRILEKRRWLLARESRS
jgi:multiple sugar transport system substrate-binding protein